MGVDIGIALMYRTNFQPENYLLFRINNMIQKVLSNVLTSHHAPKRLKLYDTGYDNSLLVTIFDSDNLKTVK